ncbi:TspO/MBR family protein [Methylocapsa acidiphila]|uniref:Probable tryptophan rich sensory protein: integral membrane protein n=1 Tax=Methylocapsa acidiphila TaxID=133552 RepID=Q2VNH7_METAI|nr:TspO/MBR family protein [Methylocapsa acidiphila]CAJ01655.1 probable tryptophan rich sensory protein: integral membrane protein [Methylocapsa acidiphila]
MGENALIAPPVRSMIRLGLCLALCAAIAGLGGRATASQIPTWYASLAKPPWTPPNFVFPLAWGILYLLIALSLWRLWDRAVPSPARTRALRLFVGQLVLNAIWSPIFFGLHAIWSGFAILLAICAILAATIFQSAKADRASAMLLAPYFAWLCYAGALNGAILILNR